MSLFHEIQITIFRYCVTLQSDGWASWYSTTAIVHADMTLTRSEVKVKVTGLLNFRKLARPCVLAAMIVSPLAGLSGYVVVSLRFVHNGIMAHGE